MAPGLERVPFPERAWVWVAACRASKQARMNGEGREDQLSRGKRDENGSPGRKARKTGPRTHPSSTIRYRQERKHRSHDNRPRPRSTTPIRDRIARRSLLIMIRDRRANQIRAVYADHARLSQSTPRVRLLNRWEDRGYGDDEGEEEVGGDEEGVERALGAGEEDVEEDGEGYVKEVHSEG